MSMKDDCRNMTGGGPPMEPRTRDYASELAERKFREWHGEGWRDDAHLLQDVKNAIEGAIREALAKAAEVVDQDCQVESCGNKRHVTNQERQEAADRIRALGAKR